MKKLFIFSLVFILLISLTSAFSTNTFNNSLSKEALTFTGNQNITRYLGIPQNTNFLIGSQFNISGGILYYLQTINLILEPSNKITTCLELQNITTNLTGFYYLGNNIDCSDTKNWNSGKGFIPIGNVTNNFVGGLDGRGFSIDNLYINRSELTDDNIGIFAYVNGRRSFNNFNYSIVNLNINNATIYGHDYVAILVGFPASGVFNNIQISGNVYGNNNVGGFTTGTFGGTFYRTFVNKLVVYANVTGNDFVGGIFATANGNGGTISQVFFAGNVTSVFNYGGITGFGCSSFSGTPYYLNETLQGLTNTFCGTALNNTVSKNLTYFVGFDGNWTDAGNTNYPVFNNTKLNNINISINNNQIYYYPGNFTQSNNRTSNFASIVNTYLSTCTILNGFCNVPIQFHSDTAGIVQYSDLEFNNYDYLFNNVTYNTTSIETKQEGFILNISYDTNFYTSASAKLNYNGTNYTSTLTENTNNLIISNNIDVPFGTGNKSFYWIITLTNSSGDNIYYSNTYNQTISALTSFQIAQTCGTLSTAMLFNGTFETNLSKTNLSKIDYKINISLGSSEIGSLIYGTLTNVPGFKICINTTQNPTWTINDGEIFYEKTGYAPRRYYIYSNTRLTSTPINISLHVLDNSLETGFELTIEDSSLNPYTNIYTSLIRWYPGSNEYRVVDVGKTDEYGKTVIHVETEDVDYRIGVYETDGTLIYLSTPVRMICLDNPCTYNLKISPVDLDYTSLLKIEYALTYNETTGVWRFIYNDPSQATSLMNMTVYLDSGVSRVPICSSTQSASTGSITCNTSGYQYGTQVAIVARSASPPVIIAQKIWNFASSAFRGDTFALWLVWLIMIPIVFIFGLYSPVAGLFGAVIALIPAYYLGSINIGIFTGIIALGAIVVHFLRRL